MRPVDTSLPENRIIRGGQGGMGAMASLSSVTAVEAAPASRGRKEKRLSGSDPVTAFALKLRHARRQAGSPSYRQMATVAHYSAPPLSQAASGRKLPTWPLTAAYLRACGACDLAEWENEWRIAHLAVQLTSATPQTAITGRLDLIHDRRSDASTLDGDTTPHQQLLDLLTSLAHRKGLTPRAISARTRKALPTLAADRGPVIVPTAAIREVLAGKAPVTAEFICAFVDAVAASPEEQHTIGQAIARLQHNREAQTFAPRQLANNVEQVQQHADGVAARAIGRAAVPAARRLELPVDPAYVASDAPLSDLIVVAAAKESHAHATRPTSQRAGASFQSTGWDSRIRSHRMAAGFHGQDSSALSLAPKRERGEPVRPGVVVGTVAAAGILLNVVAYIIEVVRTTPAAQLATAIGSIVATALAAHFTVAVLIIRDRCRHQRKAERGGRHPVHGEEDAAACEHTALPSNDLSTPSAVTPAVERDTLPVQGHPGLRPAPRCSRVCAHQKLRPTPTVPVWP